MTNETDAIRRSLLQAAMAIAASGTLSAQPAAAADNDDRWARIAAEYPRSSRLLNLNNAAVSPQPRPVLDAMWNAYRFANEIPDVNMWDMLDAARPRIRQKLAQLADCDVNEVALNRNATEGLCTAIFGIDLKAGDEVMLCDWDYETMRHAWEQRERRDGIRLVRVPFDLMADDDAIIAAYRRALSPKTKVMHVTHVVHYNGRVLPVQQLCAMARERGIQTIVDAAQSFAHLPISFRRLGCDYLAASLHKWLCAPFGTGILLVRQDRAGKLWPLIASYVEAPRGIDRFDAGSQATYSSAAETAIEAAVDFHNGIGTADIHARLQYLTRYWVERARDIPGFQMQTPIDSPATNAVSLFSLKGRTAESIEQALREKHAVRVRYRRQGSLSGVRVSPHVYTTTADLDRFTQALRSVAISG